MAPNAICIRNHYGSRDSCDHCGRVYGVKLGGSSMKMKVTYHYLGIISVSIFLFSILISGYLLYNLPMDIDTQVKTLDQLQMQQLSKIMGNLSLAVSIGLISALVAILVLMFGARNETVATVVSPVAAEIIQTEKEKDESTTEEAIVDQSERFRKVEQVLSVSPNKDLRLTMEKALRSFCTELEACQGALFLTEHAEGKNYIEFCAGYAYHLPDSQRLRYEFGEGLAGQVAKEGLLVNLSSVPDNYITILSGLGKSSPNHLIIAPLRHADSSEVLGVMEIASFKPFGPSDEELITQVAAAFAQVLGPRVSVGEGV